MTATLTSLIFSIIAVLAILAAFKDGEIWDMRMLCCILVSSTALVCSWLVRIEASIDNKNKEVP